MNNPILRVFFDASALVKRYSSEPGTALLNELFTLLPIEKMACSMLGILEVISILVRKRNDRRLIASALYQVLADFDAEIVANQQFHKTSVHNALLISATALIQKHNLNSADTIILRSALNLQQALLQNNEALLLWTSDKRLARAASAEGLRVFDPEIETLGTLHALFPPPTT